MPDACRDLQRWLKRRAFATVSTLIMSTGAPEGSELDLRSRVASRFGLVPSFFQTAGDAPGLIDELWKFAQSAYLDNPLPSLFKERLFVHLSRFCEVRYCIVRHVGFLIGEGNPAGDPDAIPESVEQVVELLRQPGVADPEALAQSLSRLEAHSGPIAVPSSGSQAERDVFAAASVLFIDPKQADRARKALGHALGMAQLELLTAYLAFIRTAHYWTETHPDLTIEDDMETLMRQHEDLARLLLDPSDGERCQVGSRLFDELAMLRDEHDDQTALKAALADNQKAQEHQRLLINELNHRVKNTLAIIQSIAMQTLRNEVTSPQVREGFVSRLIALAGAHDIQTLESWEGAAVEVVLHKAIGVHLRSAGETRVTFEGPPFRLPPKIAVALAMAIHELVTNALQYGALSNDDGGVDVRWGTATKAGADLFWLKWEEVGGPEVSPPTRRGFGSRLIERGLAGELDGIARLTFAPSGLVCEIEAPMSILAADA